MALIRHGRAERLVDALRESSALFLDLLQTRVALFANELQIELLAGRWIGISHGTAPASAGRVRPSRGRRVAAMGSAAA